MKAAFHFTYEKDWRTAPVAFWVHVPVPGTADTCDPPAPVAVPHRGYAFLHVEFESHELQFSALAQLDHFIQVLSRKPLPTSRQLSLRRGVPVGPNSHWLSRLPAELKSPRKREKLTQALGGIRKQAAGPWSNQSIEPPPRRQAAARGSASALSLMGLVSAFRLRDRYFVHPNKRTTAGLWVAQPDFMCLPLDATPESIGLAILASLAQSRGTVPHPSDWSAVSMPRLAAAGVRSERAFVVGASLVQIEDGGGLHFEPTHNGGSSGDERGFCPAADGRETLPLHSAPQVVGETFLKALRGCTVETSTAIRADHLRRPLTLGRTKDMPTRVQSFFDGTTPPLRLAFLGFIIAGIGVAIAFSIDYGPHNPLSIWAFGLGAFGIGLGYCGIAWGWGAAISTLVSKLVRGARSK